MQISYRWRAGRGCASIPAMAAVVMEVVMVWAATEAEDWEVVEKAAADTGLAEVAAMAPVKEICWVAAATAPAETESAVAAVNRPTGRAAAVAVAAALDGAWHRLLAEQQHQQSEQPPTWLGNRKRLFFAETVILCLV